MTKFAMVFPGQGAQCVGMLSELAARYPIVQETFSDASSELGYDLWELSQNGPAEELNKTWRTQPALVAASVAIYKIWQQRHGAAPAMVAGHSLGEYSALVCAGVIDFNDAIRLVELRGKLMQAAVPEGEGSMYAIIGLDNNTISGLCKKAELGEIVSPVNFNSPGQTVIAGNKNAVERAATACKLAGAKRVIPLFVSVPSHCALMKPAAEKLAVTLNQIPFKLPTIPVLSNVNVKTEHDPDAIKRNLIEQLYSPVRWSEIVTTMAEQDVTVLLEVGPGKVLTGLTKRIVSTIRCISIGDPESLDMALDATKQRI